MEQIQHQDLVPSNDRTRNRYGLGLVRIESPDALLHLVIFSFTRKDKLVFKKSSTVVCSLSGIRLGQFNPGDSDGIQNSWIESTLRVGELYV